ncbi:MAG: 4-hydroxythreonine-4-phosphate dehydrogenase PdxA [Halanaerobiaceae bacterium]
MTEKITAITMGDPAGIGSEIIMKAITRLTPEERENLIVIGSLEILEEAEKMVNTAINIRSFSDIETFQKAQDKADYLNLLDMENIKYEEVNFGKIQKNCGKAAVEYIYKAIELAKKNKIAGVVTAPIHKEAIKLAGIAEAGHTEIFAGAFGVENYAMMLAEADFRVVHVSTHVSLRKACELVKKERIYQVIKLAYRSLINMGIKSPVIAVAGLNPHSGENGLFGSEEQEEIKPAVEQAKAEGIKVKGPEPPDTVFATARTGKYDIVVAMYHDQGHIPMKTAGFEYDREKQEWSSVSGVNVTLGLPIIRTSVDHGVAFDIAGKNQASPESMIQAVEMAQKMS